MLDRNGKVFVSALILSVLMIGLVAYSVSASSLFVPQSSATASPSSSPNSNSHSCEAPGNLADFNITGATNVGTSSSVVNCCPTPGNLADFNVTGATEIGSGLVTCNSQSSQSSNTAGTGVSDDAKRPTSWVDSAIGAYSTNTGLSTETTTWSNLPSSFTMTGINRTDFLLDVPTSAGGTFNCGSSQWTITGIFIQVAVQYDDSHSYAYPGMTVILIASNEDLAYSAIWTGSDLGSGSITETIEYTTYDSITGWWAVLSTSSNTYYLFSVSTSNGISFNLSGDTYDVCSSFSLSLSSLGSTSSAVTLASSTIDPSIAMEVNEDTSGHFLSDNTNAGINAVVTTGEFYYCGYGSSTDFHIGASSPPSTAYTSGFTYWSDSNHVSVKYYYDQVGTESGIQSYIDSEWGVSSASVTQTAGTNLPNLNVECVGNTCPLTRT